MGRRFGTGRPARARPGHPTRGRCEPERTRRPAAPQAAGGRCRAGSRTRQTAPSPRPRHHPTLSGPASWFCVASLGGPSLVGTVGRVGAGSVSGVGAVRGCRFVVVEVASLVERIGRGEPEASRDTVEVFEALDRGDRGDLLDGLAGAAAAGNRRPLATLIEIIDRYRLDRSAIRRILVNNDEVDEAHQDTLIAVAQSIGRFRGESAFTTWLHSVARNTAAAQLRRSQRAPSPTDEVDGPMTGQRLSSMISDRADLQNAVNSLPDHYREAVWLRDVHQLCYDEVAEQLGVGVNTVKSRISRGRALIAAALSE